MRESMKKMALMESNPTKHETQTSINNVFGKCSFSTRNFVPKMIYFNQSCSTKSSTNSTDDSSPNFSGSSVQGLNPIIS